MTVREIQRSLDPFPAFDGLEGFSVDRELFDHQLFQQCRILEPTTSILLEQVVHDDATGSVVGLDANIDRTAVTGTDGRFGQKAANVIGVPRM